MKFSIIVVCLNPGSKLNQTLDSILSQTCPALSHRQGRRQPDGSIETMRTDGRIHLPGTDHSIYEAMNQAVSHVTGDYILFLNCGDLFYDNEVLTHTAQFMEQHPAKLQGIYYGDTYSAKTETKISSPPRITGFVCYRNIPCHQSCFYAADLCRQKPYEPKYKIRADYEHFLWCYYRAKAPMQYLGLTVSSYEGGGYSETKENLKRRAAEHKEITAKYINPGELLRYRAVMALTLAPLRTALAESKHFSAMYQKLMSKAYGRKQEK
ncbi:MAG: glycosyltransferase [Waltera sp.]